MLNQFRDKEALIIWWLTRRLGGGVIIPMEELERANHPGNVLTIDYGPLPHHININAYTADTVQGELVPEEPLQIEGRNPA